MKKNIFIFLSITLIFSGFFFFYTPSDSINNLASVFEENDSGDEHENNQDISTQFLLALENKSFTFFAENITPSLEREKFITILQHSRNLMDVKIKKSEQFLFFSFLSSTAGSNTLHNNYGYWNTQTQDIFFMPSLSLEKISTSKYKNISPFPLFLSGEILGVPKDIVLISDKNDILPQETFTLTTDSDQQFKQIESIEFGFLIDIK